MVREAAKLLLTEYTRKPMSTAEIKACLERGGLQTRGTDFLSNVSATLSLMANKYNEISRDEEGKWSLKEPDVPEFDPGIGDDDVPF